MRSGELSWERVELAASLGHEVARALCPEAERIHWGHRTQEPSLTAIKRARDLLDDEALPTRFACDCAQRVLEAFESYATGAEPRAALAAARAWLDDPCEANAERAAAAAADGEEADLGRDYEDPAWGRANYAKNAAVSAAQTASGEGPYRHEDNLAANGAFCAARAAADVEAEQAWQSLHLAALVLGELLG